MRKYLLHALMLVVLVACGGGDDPSKDASGNPVADQALYSIKGDEITFRNPTFNGYRFVNFEGTDDDVTQLNTLCQLAGMSGLERYGTGGQVDVYDYLTIESKNNAFYIRRNYSGEVVTYISEFTCRGYESFAGDQDVIDSVAYGAHPVERLIKARYDMSSATADEDPIYFTDDIGYLAITAFENSTDNWLQSIYNRAELLCDFYYATSSSRPQVYYIGYEWLDDADYAYDIEVHQSYRYTAEKYSGELYSWAYFTDVSCSTQINW